jgi:hypothetical protein
MCVSLYGCVTRPKLFAQNLEKKLSQCHYVDWPWFELGLPRWGLILIYVIQSVSLKIGPLAWGNQEIALFRLVFGRPNAHSYKRCWKWDPCESIHFCVRVIKTPSLISPCKRAGFKWNTLQIKIQIVPDREHNMLPWEKPVGYVCTRTQKQSLFIVGIIRDAQIQCLGKMREHLLLNQPGTIRRH